MFIGIEQHTLRGRDQVTRRCCRIHRDAQRQKIDAMTDESLKTVDGLARSRNADDHVVDTRDAVQQRGKPAD